MKITPSIFLTSDTHFGHSKIVTAGWGVRKETFNEDIIEAWNSVVTRDDIVLHLGDLTMANKETTLKWTSQLKGRKYLILGNHDNSSISWFKDVGFTVIPNAHKRFKDKYENWFDVIFTHEPVWNLPKGWFNIHGHLHGNMHRGRQPNEFQYFDVGVDAIGYKPKRLYELLAEIRRPS